jgi:predicted Zn-dependent protease
MSAIRALSLLVALAVAAWFVVGIRQAHDTAKAGAIVSGSAKLSSGQANGTASLLHAAAFLNPDTRVDILRAQLALDRGERRQAARILSSVVQKEPMNLQAWFLLAANPTNGTAFRHAIHEVTLLMPRLR